MKRYLLASVLLLCSCVAGAQSLSLHLFHFKGSRWEPVQIRAAAAEAAGLLEQCGFRVTGTELQELDVPREFHYYYTPVSRELLRRVEVRKPAVFFVEDTRNQPAYDAEAIGRGNARSRPELRDTVWVAYGARDLPQVLAHELMHVLMDSGEHSEEPRNLMRSETSPQNTQLSAAQCGLARARGSENGLLKP